MVPPAFRRPEWTLSKWPLVSGLCSVCGVGNQYSCADGNQPGLDVLLLLRRDVYVLLCSLANIRVGDAALWHVSPWRAASLSLSPANDDLPRLCLVEGIQEFFLAEKPQPTLFVKLKDFFWWFVLLASLSRQFAGNLVIFFLSKKRTLRVR